MRGVGGASILDAAARVCSHRSALDKVYIGNQSVGIVRTGAVVGKVNDRGADAVGVSVCRVGRGGAGVTLGAFAKAVGTSALDKTRFGIDSRKLETIRVGTRRAGWVRGVGVVRAASRRSALVGVRRVREETAGVAFTALERVCGFGMVAAVRAASDASDMDGLKTVLVGIGRVSGVRAVGVLGEMSDRSILDVASIGGRRGVRVKGEITLNTLGRDDGAREFDEAFSAGSYRALEKILGRIGRSTGERAV